MNKQEELLGLYKAKSDFSIIKRKKKEIETHLKRMSNQIVQIRLKDSSQREYLRGSDDNYFSLYKINFNNYSFEKGVDLKENECLI